MHQQANTGAFMLILDVLILDVGILSYRLRRRKNDKNKSLKKKVFRTRRVQKLLVVMWYRVKGRRRGGGE